MAFKRNRRIRRRRYRRRTTSVRIVNPRRRHISRVHRALTSGDKYFTRMFASTRLEITNADAGSYIYFPTPQWFLGFNTLAIQFEEFKIHKIFVKIIPSFTQTQAQIVADVQGGQDSYAFATIEQSNIVPTATDMRGDNNFTYGYLMSLPYAKSKRLHQQGKLLYRPKLHGAVMVHPMDDAGGGTTPNRALGRSLIKFPWCSTQNYAGIPLGDGSTRMTGVAIAASRPSIGNSPTISFVLEFFAYVTFRKRITTMRLTWAPPGGQQP